MTSRTLSQGQVAVLTVTAVAMAAVGGFGAWGTYSNIVSAFHRQATAAGVVAAGEGLTLILALTMLGRTMLGQSSPLVVRAGMWAAPAAASCTGMVIAASVRETAVFAITPLAMSGAAEGLGLIARSVVVYRTGTDADTVRRNADTARRLAFYRAVADRHPSDWVRKWADRKSWRLARQIGVGDTELGTGLVGVQRTRVTAGADAALASMYGTPAAQQETKPARPTSAQEILRRRFAEMDPADAVRIAHDAQPDMPPAELASLLVSYGVVIDPVQVALTLHGRPAEYEVHRVDAPDAPQVKALDPVTVEGAIVEAASALGPDASAREIAEHVARNRRLVVTEPYVRTALSRAAKKATPDTPAQPMEGGYA